MISTPFLSGYRRRDDGLVRYACGHAFAAEKVGGVAAATGFVDVACRECFWRWYWKKRERISRWRRFAVLVGARRAVEEADASTCADEDDYMGKFY